MCCAQDALSPFLNDHKGVDCRSDGLCADLGNNAVWRTACTYDTWQSPECIKLCINGTNEAGNDIQVMQCSNGSHCCGGSTYNDIATYCCSGGQGSVWTVDGEETNVNPNLSVAPSRAPSAKAWYSPTISDAAALTSVQLLSETAVLEIVSPASRATTVSSSPAKSRNHGNPNVSTTPSGAPSSTTSYSPTTSNPTTSTSVHPPSETTVSEVVSSASRATRVASSPAKSDNDGNRAAKIAGCVFGVIGLALILGTYWFVFSLMRRKRPHPPPMTNGKHSQRRGNDPINEAPTYAGDTKRYELAGLPVSRAELYESRITYYELEQRIENFQRHTYQNS